MTVREIRKHSLVGFAGKAGVGKTTTAEWFVKGHNFVRLSFAQPLKSCLVALTGLSMNHFTDIELKEKEIPGLGVSPRVMMQLGGTEFVRNMIYHDFFLWRMGHLISENSHRDIVIDDVRFENEAEFIRSNGGKIVHLTREFESPTTKTSHKSEDSLEIKKGDIVAICDISEELTALNLLQRFL